MSQLEELKKQDRFVGTNDKILKVKEFVDMQIKNLSGTGDIFSNYWTNGYETGVIHFLMKMKYYIDLLSTDKIFVKGRARNVGSIKAPNYNIDISGFSFYQSDPDLKIINYTKSKFQEFKVRGHLFLRQDVFKFESQAEPKK